MKNQKEKKGKPTSDCACVGGDGKICIHLHLENINQLKIRIKNYEKMKILLNNMYSLQI